MIKTAAQYAFLFNVKNEQKKILLIIFSLFIKSHEKELDSSCFSILAVSRRSLLLIENSISFESQDILLKMNKARVNLKFVLPNIVNKDRSLQLIQILYRKGISLQICKVRAHQNRTENFQIFFS